MKITNSVTYRLKGFSLHIYRLTITEFNNMLRKRSRYSVTISSALGEDEMIKSADHCTDDKLSGTRQMAIAESPLVKTHFHEPLYDNARRWRWYDVSVTKRTLVDEYFCISFCNSVVAAVSPNFRCIKFKFMKSRFKI